MNLLERAKKNLPETVEYKGRFSPPMINSFIQGNKTIITNLKDISKYLNRDFNHLVKFFVKEFACSYLVKDDRLILTGRFNGRKLNEKLEKYINTYVICKECGSPDTKLERKDNILYLKCMACQAEYPVPKI